ncbi:MAG: YbjQ family protein [Desulfobacterales bacterium]|nr:YbjQ family protein [Desulfobacterales bacterium]
MKIIRNVGSLAFVLGLFVVIFAGIPWYVMVADDPAAPWWMRTAVFSLLGGILVVLASVGLEQRKYKADQAGPKPTDTTLLLSNTPEIPRHEIAEVLGLAQGHTVYAIWLGKDLSALIRLILGGELTEYTEMMGRARKAATERMVGQADEMGADAIINVRYMTTSVVGSAAELLVYGTAVKLNGLALKV